MHELSIAQSLLDIVLDEGQKHRFVKVHAIKLQIGALAAVVPDSLKFCFELVSQNTIASGCSLEVETVPVVARCPSCNEHFEVENHVFVCPTCNGPAQELVSGRELVVMSIEGESSDGDGEDADSRCSKYSSG